MRINHNIQALNAYRQLSHNQGLVSKHLERLSSGLRINRAADDAAGLAISEKMRSQIRGLGMAERNTMDGISLIQTAEGALGTTHEILQRMKELSIQAANGTLDDQDRKAIQAEIDQLTFEIDRIAKTTQFNAKTLLRGEPTGRSFASTDSSDVKYTSANDGSWEGVVTADPTSKASVELNLDVTFGNLPAAGADGLTFTINGKIYELDVAGGTAGVATDNVAVNIASWAGGGTDTDAKTNVDNVLNALKTAIMANDPTFDSAASVVTPSDNSTAANGAFETNGKLVLKTTKYMTPDEASKIGVTTAATGANFYEEGTTTAVSKVVGKPDATATKSVTISYADVPKAGDSIKIDNITVTFGTPASAYDPTTNSATLDVTNKSIYDILNEIGNILTTVSSDPVEKANALPALSSHSISGNGLVLFTDKTNDGKSFGDPTSNGLEVQIKDADFISTAGTNLKLDMQIGPNASEYMELSIGVMDAATLGLARGADHTTIITTPGVDAVAGIDVSSTSDAARAATTVIENAIKKVSEERSKLGAFQNRMEHTVSNLKLTNENLTAAESRIRDADMAYEMTNFTKNNIINQAATAMLAQANQLPQGILQLLK